MNPEIAKLFNFSDMSTSQIYGALDDMPRGTVDGLMQHYGYEYDSEIAVDGNLQLFAEHIMQLMGVQNDCKNNSAVC